VQLSEQVFVKLCDLVLDPGRHFGKDNPRDEPPLSSWRRVFMYEKYRTLSPRIPVRCHALLRSGCWRHGPVSDRQLRSGLSGAKLFVTTEVLENVYHFCITVAF
jgi:hypothetical protein